MDMPFKKLNIATLLMPLSDSHTSFHAHASVSTEITTYTTSKVAVGIVPEEVTHDVVGRISRQKPYFGDKCFE